MEIPAAADIPRHRLQIFSFRAEHGRHVLRSDLRRSICVHASPLFVLSAVDVLDDEADADRRHEFHRLLLRFLGVVLLQDALQGRHVDRWCVSVCVR